MLSDTLLVIDDPSIVSTSHEKGQDKKLKGSHHPRRGKNDDLDGSHHPMRSKISSRWELYAPKFFVIFLLLMLYR